MILVFWLLAVGSAQLLLVRLESDECPWFEAADTRWLANASHPCLQPATRPWVPVFDSAAHASSWVGERWPDERYRNAWALWDLYVLRSGEPLEVAVAPLTPAPLLLSKGDVRVLSVAEWRAYRRAEPDVRWPRLPQHARRATHWRLLSILFMSASEVSFRASACPDRDCVVPIEPVSPAPALYLAHWVTVRVEEEDALLRWSAWIDLDFASSGVVYVQPLLPRNVTFALRLSTASESLLNVVSLDRDQVSVWPVP